REVEQRYVLLAHDEMRAPTFDHRRPAIAQQDERVRLDHARHQFIPDKRQLCHRAHPAAYSDETHRARDQILQAFIKMRARHLVRKITVRLSLKLIHHDAKHTSAPLMRPTTRRLHHTQITARANREARSSQQLPDPPRLRILLRVLAALRAAEYRYDAFVHNGRWTIDDGR